MRDSERYADAAVSMLASLGVTHLAFGCEEEDPSRLLSLSEALDNRSPAFEVSIKNQLDKGKGYPSAVADAVSAVFPEYGNVMNGPNNILALSYLRSIRKHHPHVTPVFIHRKGNYSDTSVDPVFPSATSVRSALLRGDWLSVQRSVPEFSFSLLRREALEGRLIHSDAFSDILLYRLRTMDSKLLASLPDLSEGLENRIAKAAADAVSMSDLLDKACSRRYPKARICRICSHLLLEAEKSGNIPKKIPAAILLGIKKGTVLQDSEIGIISKMADYKSDEEWFRYEILSYEAAGLAAGLPSGLAFRQGVAVL